MTHRSEQRSYAKFISNGGIRLAIKQQLHTSRTAVATAAVKGRSVASFSARTSEVHSGAGLQKQLGRRKIPAGRCHVQCRLSLFIKLVKQRKILLSGGVAQYLVMVRQDGVWHQGRSDILASAQHIPSALSFELIQAGSNAGPGQTRSRL